MEIQRQSEAFAYRIAAGEFDPSEVTNRLENEFYDWQEQQPEDRYSDHEWNIGIGHWPAVEDFLKDRYPAAHRGFANGREDAWAFMKGYNDSPIDYAKYLADDEEPYDYDAQPYQVDLSTQQQLGYDPEEVVAGMVLLHNKAHSGRGNAYEPEDKQTLVDIFNKREKMQQDYERRMQHTAAGFLSSPPERAQWMMNRRWNEQSHSPAELRKQHLDQIKGRPDLKEEWKSRPKDREFSGPERLPQPTLPGMNKIRGTDSRLMRGMPIDTTDPDFRRVWQMTYGQGQPVDDPGMFPDADLHYEDRGGQFDHPGLADAILQGLTSGAGEHWTTDYDIADAYGWGIGEGSGGSGDWENNEELPVFFDADWSGRGEDYDRAGSGNVDYEKEVMLNHGAPLTLRDLRVPPGRDDYEDYPAYWESILPDSRDITAANEKRMQTTAFAYRNGQAPLLESTNPTGGLFVDYDPQSRTGPVSPRLTTLDKARGRHPDEPVVIYRGAPAHQHSIVPGDYVTTNQQLARDYAGIGKILQMKVRHQDLITDPDEWEGEEYIYHPSS